LFAFVTGVGVYAKAGAATTANAVSAFATDASSQGRTQASVNFAQNVGAAQQPAKPVASSASKANTTLTSAAPQAPASPPAAQVAAATPKTYSCPASDNKFIDVVPNLKDSEDGWSSPTDTLACQKAHRRAIAFADGLSNPGFLGQGGKVTSIGTCSLKTGAHDRRYATVTVQYLAPSESPCGAESTGVSR
jgi:hypothetical protein